jgi:glycosyltransferase involved in cell wall biosynthesis
MKLSAIIPTYNRAALLGRVINSIQSVPHRPLEIVVVDDGSTDETPLMEATLTESCLKSGVEIRWIRQANAGASVARNTGVDLCSGELIQWVDADDTVRPAGVQALVDELISSPAVDIVYGLVDVVDLHGQRGGVMGMPCAHAETDLFDLLWHTMGAVYRKKSLRDTLRWNPSLVLGDDWDFSARARIAGLKYKFIPTIVGDYLKHDFGSLTISEFEETKCFGVIQAVLSIRDALVAEEKLSPKLQQRCYNRVLVHAVELSANGSGLSEQAFQICHDIGSPNLLLGMLPLAMRRLPFRGLHELVFRVLRSR